jgi:putative FmdB family regulatory protein
MPVYDFECTNPMCDYRKEFILCIKESENTRECPECWGTMKKIISASGQYLGNNDADWLKCVTDVVDPEGGVAAQEFRKNPTRSNYKEWMKESGVRPMEGGERMKPEPTNLNKVKEEVLRKHYERMTDSEYRRRSERILKRGHHG